ncbi:hypothetical protein Dimus_031789 [Dionaea muscipula]
MGVLIMVVVGFCVVLSGRTAGGHRRCPGRGDAWVAALRRVTGDALVVAVPVVYFGGFVG